MQETSKLLAQSARLDCLLQFETQLSDDGQLFADECILRPFQSGSRPPVSTHFETVAYAFIRAENDCQLPDTWVWNFDKHAVSPRMHSLMHLS